MKGLVFLMLFILGGVTMAKAVSPPKVVMVIAHKNFRDEELFVTKQTLERKGVQVVVASSALTPAKGMLGRSYKPDILIKDINMDDYDALVFVGGMGATEYWDNEIAHNLARAALEKNKVLKGKKATVWSSEANQLKSLGAIYTGKSVERDGLIITANGPQAAEEFGKAILAALGL